MMSHLDCPQATGLGAAGFWEEHIAARTESVGHQDGGVHSPNDIWYFWKTESSLDFWHFGLKILFTWDIHHELIIPLSNDLKKILII